ncbi:hypothetical protein EW145_g4941 [Phellinidium pouzarii]|uniref:Uncharacterized protein n=1 Tax=Phellinidium pouzarii TaxID=167371 RepID=A0A4S4L1Z6_9AGAM|nr:hypothetical protein EW145_g4941 [Phellinidium pouzarii]
MSVFNTSRLLGKTILITGASGGIGAVSRAGYAATALLFAKAGSNLILLARRAEALQKVVNAVKAVQGSGRVAGVQLDVSDKAQVASLWDKVPQDLRNVDVLGTVGDIKPEDYESMFTTNVFGLIAMTQLLIKDFKERKSGHVINIGSVAGREPYVGASIYCATKHAVRAFSGSLMREVVDTPIRVTEIQPDLPEGMVETGFSVVRFRGDKSAADKVYEGLQPLVAEDIAEEIVWAASRPPHVNLAEVYVLPVNQASPTIAYRSGK